MTPTPRHTARAAGALAALVTLAGSAAAQTRVVAPAALYSPTAPGATLACAPAAANDLADRSDEFDGARPLTGEGGRWRWFHEQFGWPSMVRRADVGTASPGRLTLEPEQSGWFADYHAPFLFQPVRGDFDVVA